MPVNLIEFIWFVVFGALCSAMIGVTDFPTALAVFLAYCLGGMVVFGIISPNMRRRIKELEEEGNNLADRLAVRLRHIDDLTRQRDQTKIPS